MRKFILAAGLVLLWVAIGQSDALCQGVRFGDGQTVSRTATVAGNASVLVVAPSATINFCNAPGINVPCTNKATTYTDATLTTACSSSTQVVLAGTTTCVGTADANGNWGVWAPAGQYTYTITIGSTNSGPYYATLAPSAAANTGLVNTFTSQQNFDANVRFKGSDPWADVTAFGARGVGSTVFPQTTATMSASSTTATLAAASTFQNGDGVTIYGAGATISLTTPTAPTATPSIAAGGTSTGIVKNSATSASTYDYVLVARTKFGGLTAAGTTGTITNGQATLGLQTATITTCSRANDVVTCNTSAANLLVVGALVHIYGGSNADFTGWFTVGTINSTTQFVINNTVLDSRGIGWQLQDSNSSTGGSASYYLSNHLTWTHVTGAWEYYVCAKRPGDASLALIGQTKPSATSWIDAQFDDYGSPYMDSQTYPSYVTNAVCTAGAAVPDPLTTTIVSGAGTTTLVLANAATNAVSAKTILFDNAPAILAAANSISGNSKGTLYFPPVTDVGQGFGYLVSSYLVLPTKLSIKQAGAIFLKETLQVSADTNWEGSWSEYGTPQFGFGGPAAVSLLQVNPGIYATGSGIVASYLSFSQNNSNGGTLWVLDNANAEWDYVNFSSGGTNDTDRLSMNLVIRSQSSGGNGFHWRKSLFTGGPNQVGDKSWTPLVYFPPNQNGSGGLFGNQNNFGRWLECYFNRRGIEEQLAGGSAAIKDFEGGYRQGGITPLLMLGNSVGNASGTIRFSYVQQDTETVSTLTLLGSTGLVVPQVVAVGLINSSAEAGGIPPPFTGTRPAQTFVTSFSTGKVPTRNTFSQRSHNMVVPPYDTLAAGYSSHASLDLFDTVHFPGGHSLFWDLPAPTNVSATLAAGGTLAIATYTYDVSAVDAINAETVMSLTPSSAVTTTGGNQTINITWTGVVGAVSYNVYRCTSACTISDGRVGSAGNWRQIKLQQTGTSLSDTGAFGLGPVPPDTTSAGKTVLNGSGVYTPSLSTGKLDNVIWMDGTTYPYTAAGLQAAINAALALNTGSPNVAGGSLVVIPKPFVIGATTITVGTTGTTADQTDGTSVSLFFNAVGQWTCSGNPCFEGASRQDIGGLSIGFTQIKSTGAGPVFRFTSPAERIHIHDIRVTGGLNAVKTRGTATATDVPNIQMERFYFDSQTGNAIELVSFSDTSFVRDGFVNAPTGACLRIGVFDNGVPAGQQGTNENSEVRNFFCQNAGTKGIWVEPSGGTTTLWQAGSLVFDSVQVSTPTNDAFWIKGGLLNVQIRALLFANLTFTANTYDAVHLETFAGGVSHTAVKLSGVQQGSVNARYSVFWDLLAQGNGTSNTLESMNVATGGTSGIFLRGQIQANTFGNSAIAATSVFTGFQPGATIFANLGTPANGFVFFCSDCTIANPCAGAGTGALAKRLNGVWVCN